MDDVKDKTIKEIKQDALFKQYLSFLKEKVSSRDADVDFSTTFFISKDGRYKVYFPVYRKSTDIFFKYRNDTEYEIVKMPVIEKLTKQEKVLVKKTTTKSKEREKKSNKEANENEAVKDFVLKNRLPFVFKTQAECLSSSPTKKYFISKTALINQIKQDPELSKYFPKELLKSTSSKKEICKHIFE